jgi:integrase
MARQRVVQTGITTRKWGVNNPTKIQRARKDNSQYTEWRVAYYAQVPYLDEKGEIIGFERKRRYACSTENGPAATKLAEKRRAESFLQEEEFWNGEKVKRGEFLIQPKEVAQTPPRRSIEQVVFEMMKVRVRYEDGEVVGARHSYAKKIRNYLNHLEKSPLANKPMDTMQLLTISQWFAGFMYEHAESTSARFKSFLVQTGKWALNNGYWSRNLFEQLPEMSMRASVESERIYSFDEIDAMWQAAELPREKALLVLLRCGLRQGECLGLTESHIINDHTIQIHYSLGETENQWNILGRGGAEKKYVDFLGKTKTRSSKARVHIPQEWMKYLVESLALSEDCLIPAFDDKRSPRLHKFVLSNRFGTCWREWAASRCIKKLMLRARISLGENDSTFHAWRHTFCSDLVVLGANDIELSYFMRHTDSKLSKSVYAAARHEHLSAMAKYARRIDSLTDYIDAIAQMDSDRRSLGLETWIKAKQIETPEPSQTSFM